MQRVPILLRDSEYKLPVLEVLQAEELVIVGDPRGQGGSLPSERDWQCRHGLVTIKG